MALGPSYWESELGPHPTVALFLLLEELMKMQFVRPHSCCFEGLGPREMLLSAQLRQHMLLGLEPLWESCTSTSLGPVIWGTLLSQLRPAFDP